MSTGPRWPLGKDRLTCSGDGMTFASGNTSFSSASTRGERPPRPTERAMWARRAANRLLRASEVGQRMTWAPDPRSEPACFDAQRFKWPWPWIAACARENSTAQSIARNAATHAAGWRGTRAHGTTWILMTRPSRVNPPPSTARLRRSSPRLSKLGRCVAGFDPSHRASPRSQEQRCCMTATSSGFLSAFAGGGPFDPRSINDEAALAAALHARRRSNAAQNRCWV